MLCQFAFNLNAVDKNEMFKMARVSRCIRLFDMTTFKLSCFLHQMNIMSVGRCEKNRSDRV